MKTRVPLYFPGWAALLFTLGVWRRLEPARGAHTCDALEMVS